MHEEDGSVIIQDDLDALLQVKLQEAPSCYIYQFIICPTLIDRLSLLRDCNLQVLPQDIRNPLVSHKNRASLLEVMSSVHSFALTWTGRGGGGGREM
jgi:hypothetical protein